MSGLHWSPTEDSLLRELVSSKKLSFAQMAKRFPGRTGTGLRKRAINYLGLDHSDYIHRLHYYHQDFFETPNPLNCYAAGYYAADGCIQDNPTTRVVTMSLAPEDRAQVEVFKTMLGYTGEVTHDDYEYKQMYSLRLYGAHKLAADMERHFGLVPRKTHRLPAPNLTDPHLQLCYLAGLLDGDGCVSISNRGLISVSYVSASRAIADWVGQYIQSLNLLSLKLGRHANVRSLTHAKAFRYQVCGCKALDLIRRVQALKHHHGIPVLDRKWDNPALNAYIAAFEAKHGVNLTPSPSLTSIIQPIIPPSASV